MPRKVTPMKMHNFYCSDELWKAMQDAAISLNESDSEYVRKAIEQRNEHNKAIEKIPADKIVSDFINNPDSFDIKPVKPGTIRADTPTGKSKMVQTFMKGEKK